MLRSDMVGKAAVHFLVNMLEAYYFADAEAVNSVLGTKLQDFDGVADRRPARQHLGWVRGCRAGTDAKYTLICDEYGFAGAINYKSENTSERLRALCPEGVNVYFDNVAGSTLDAVLENMGGLWNRRGLWPHRKLWVGGTPARADELRPGSDEKAQNRRLLYHPTSIIGSMRSTRY